METVVGGSVVHNTLGRGSIIKQYAKYIEIQFENDNSIRKFQFPNAFSKFIRAEGSLGVQIKKLLETSMITTVVPKDDVLENKLRRIDFTEFEEPQIMYIYKRSCHCISCERLGISESIEHIIAQIPIFGDTEICRPVKAQFCKSCGKYYISATILKTYEKQYGVLLFDRRLFEGDYHTGDSVFAWFSQDSILSRYGYNAKEDGPGDSERREILRFLIESELSTQSEIMEYLSGFIDLQAKRAPQAREKWEKDRLYVRDYNIENLAGYKNFILRWRK
jgi:hypothetical protein